MPTLSAGQANVLVDIIQAEKEKDKNHGQGTSG
jgi:hypothetical protein